jgi:hypothetical protein
MKPGFVTIPFKVEGDGMERAEGLAKFSPVGIVLEFDTKFLGMIKTGYKDIRIPKSEIMDVKLVHGLFNSNFEKFFHTRIHIRLNNYLLMSEIPSKDGRIIMQINRRDRDLADLALVALEDKPTSIPEDLLSGVRGLFGDEAKTRDLADTNEI